MSGARYGEYQVGDLLALDAHRWFGKHDILGGVVAEERPAASHHHWYQINHHLIEQAEVQALPGDVARADEHGLVTGNSLCLIHRSLNPIGHE